MKDPYKKILEEQAAEMDNWRRRMIKIIVTIVILLISILVWINHSTKVKNDAYWASQTPEEMTRISEMRDTLSQLKGKEFIEFTDEGIQFVQTVHPIILWVVPQVGTPPWAFDHKMASDRKIQQILRVIRPTDPDYPQIAVRFINQR